MGLILVADQSGPNRPFMGIALPIKVPTSPPSPIGSGERPMPPRPESTRNIDIFANSAFSGLRGNPPDAKLGHRNRAPATAYPAARGVRFRMPLASVGTVYSHSGSRLRKANLGPPPPPIRPSARAMANFVRISRF